LKKLFFGALSVVLAVVSPIFPFSFHAIQSIYRLTAQSCVSLGTT
jgi:hypothetical protein